MKKCLGVCARKETIKQYNTRVLKILSKYSYNSSKASIFLNGRTDSEKSFVLIKNGVYMGYGFFPNDLKEDEVLENSKYIITQKENRDTKRIIHSYLKKNEK